jgi:hypothetical protein
MGFGKKLWFDEAERLLKVCCRWTKLRHHFMTTVSEEVKRCMI